MNNNSGAFTVDEFYNRGVIKLAPDALVYIGGSLQTTVIAPVSGIDNSLSFNDGITTINVQNNSDPPGSSNASIEIATPIYGENSNYWVFYKGIDSSSPIRAPLFVPMMEVKIYFKGRFFVKNKPRYYPVFWGFITNVEENYSGGLYKITLSCADILHWWSYSTINVHPSLESNIMAGSKQILTVWSSIFKEGNPYTIISSLVNDMGMHQFVTPVWAVQITNLEDIYPQSQFQQVAYGAMAYWNQRFATIGNLLKMYGINGKRVDAKGLQMRVPDYKIPKKNFGSYIEAVRDARDDFSYSLEPDYIRQFMPFANFEDLKGFENAEYMSKLEVASTLKDRIEFEFYQDTNGNFIFKPPFYNLNVKGILPYTILASEIISYSFSLDSEAISTVISIYTPFDKYMKQTSIGRGVGFHMDLDLMKHYGVRSAEKTIEYLRNDALAATIALSQLNMMNAKAQTGNVTIPGRPEMRLGYPIYIEHRDSFHYVKSINHAFDFGGTFTTTLALETERRKVFDPENPSEILKDKVFRFTNKLPESLNVKTNEEDPPLVVILDENEQKEEILLKGENRVFSQTQGRYEVDDRTKAPSDTAFKEMSVTPESSPYTDEEGFKVIGAFPYGRNLNAINVLSSKKNLPVLKDVYLTTMARPIYVNESNSMGILFFDDEEGAVPAYLDFEQGELPTTLGIKKDILLEKVQALNNTQTKAEQVKTPVTKEKQKNKVTKDVVQTTTQMQPQSAITNAPTGKNSQKLVNSFKFQPPKWP